MAKKSSNDTKVSEVEKHAREFDEFRKTLKSSFSAEQITKWTRLAPLKHLGVIKSIWGSVQWSKSLGKPLGVPLANGIIIEHNVLQVYWEDRPPAPAKKHILRFPGNSISTWEIPDTDNYIVGFWTIRTPDRAFEIKVNFAPNVPWEKVSPTAFNLRFVRPPSQEFEADDRTSILKPFVIVPVLLYA